MPFITTTINDPDDSSCRPNMKEMLISDEFAKIMHDNYSAICNSILYRTSMLQSANRPAFVYNGVLYVNSIVDPNNIFTWYKYDIGAKTYTKSSIVMDKSIGYSGQQLKYSGSFGDSTGYVYILPVYCMPNLKVWSVVLNSNTHKVTAFVIIDYISNTYTLVNTFKSDNPVINYICYDLELIYASGYIGNGNGDMYILNLKDGSLTSRPSVNNNDGVGLDAIGYMRAKDGTKCYLCNIKRNSSSDPLCLRVFALTGDSYEVKISNEIPETDNVFPWLMYQTFPTTIYNGSSYYSVGYKYPSTNISFMYSLTTQEIWAFSEIDLSNKTVKMTHIDKLPNYSNTFLDFIDNGHIKSSYLNTNFPTSYDDGWGDNSYFTSHTACEGPFIMDFSHPGRSYLYPDIYNSFIYKTSTNGEYASATMDTLISSVLIEYDISDIINCI